MLTILLVQMSVMSFADQVEFSTGHPCYSEDLALMTPANKEQLTAFAGHIRVATVQANFSNAFAKAFNLLANDDDGDARGNVKSQDVQYCFDSV